MRHDATASPIVLQQTNFNPRAYVRHDDDFNNIGLARAISIHVPT